jgi:hypothetical protein
MPQPGIYFNSILDETLHTSSLHVIGTIIFELGIFHSHSTLSCNYVVAVALHYPELNSTSMS